MTLKQRYIILLGLLLFIGYQYHIDILVLMDKKFNNYRESRIDKDILVDFKNSKCNETEIDTIAYYEVEDPWATAKDMIPYKRNMFSFCSYQKLNSSMVIYLGKSKKNASAYLIAHDNKTAHFSWLSESSKYYNGDFFKEKPATLKHATFELDTSNSNFIVVKADIELELLMYRIGDYYEENPISHWMKLNQCLKCKPSDKVVETILNNENMYILKNKNVIDNPIERFNNTKEKLNQFILKSEK